MGPSHRGALKHGIIFQERLGGFDPYLLECGTESSGALSVDVGSAEFPWEQEAGYRAPLLVSLIYLPLAGSPILIATLSESPSSFTNKMVAGPSNISSSEDWLLTFQRRCSLRKKSKKGRVNEGGLRLQLILDVYAAQVTIKDAGMDSFYKQF